MWKWASTSYQPATWAQHGVIAAVLPVLVAWVTHIGTLGLVGLSWLTLCFFILREERDEAKHKAAGSWGEGTRDDKVGDLVGPAAVTAAYTLMLVASKVL